MARLVITWEWFSRDVLIVTMSIKWQSHANLWFGGDADVAYASRELLVSRGAVDVALSHKFLVFRGAATMALVSQAYGYARSC